MDTKELWINLKKTKIMESECDIGSASSLGRLSCSLCKKGVNSNLLCLCEHWVHKRCSDMKGRLRSAPDYKCRKCTVEVRPLEGLPAESVAVNNESLEQVNKFCYLGAAGSVEEI